MTDIAPDPDLEDRQLRLQRMESKLVAGLFEHPGVVDRDTENRLRYALSLAALDTFQPGAALMGGRSARPDLRVRTPRLRRWRVRVMGDLRRVLLHTSDSRTRVEEAARILEPMLPALADARAEILQKYEAELSPDELDQEIGIKTLVNVAGGGGGAGYVYIGAWDVMQGAGIVPGYVIGASIGSVLGLFRALRRQGDFDEYLALAKRMKREDIFRFVSTRTRYGLPGIMRLFLHEGLGDAIRGAGSRDLTLTDLEIPYQSIVAGVRRSARVESPEAYARAHHLHEDKRPGALQLRAQIAAGLVRLVGFINPRAVREIVVGGDELTRDFNAIDAAGFSAAIPGILHYDVTRDDPGMHAIVPELMQREDVIALVDGGVANNVPVRTAWRQVQAGRIGTRNCYYLAFDCFHPRLGMAHVWLQPVTRVVAMQVALNDRYAQRRIEFQPTLSPLNLLPGPADLDRAVAWGRAQMAGELPRIQKFLERVEWAAPPSCSA